MKKFIGLLFCLILFVPGLLFAGGNINVIELDLISGLTVYDQTGHYSGVSYFETIDLNNVFGRGPAKNISFSLLTLVPDSACYGTDTADTGVSLFYRVSANGDASFITGLTDCITGTSYFVQGLNAASGETRTVYDLTIPMARYLVFGIVNGTSPFQTTAAFIFQSPDCP
jgi:hypothetical protein